MNSPSWIGCGNSQEKYVASPPPEEKEGASSTTPGNPDTDKEVTGVARVPTNTTETPTDTTEDGTITITPGGPTPGDDNEQKDVVDNSSTDTNAENNKDDIDDGDNDNAAQSQVVGKDREEETEQEKEGGAEGEKMDGLDFLLNNHTNSLRQKAYDEGASEIMQARQKDKERIEKEKQEMAQ